MTTLDRTPPCAGACVGPCSVSGGGSCCWPGCQSPFRCSISQADSLEDQQAALEAEAARVQASLEFVDSNIAKAAGDW